jgi:hypothetical protein
MPADPNEQGREYRRTEDDPERRLCQIAPGRHASELAGDEFKIAFDQGEVGSRLIGLTQCQSVIVLHAQGYATCSVTQLLRERDKPNLPFVVGPKTNIVDAADQTVSTRNQKQTR